MSTPVHPTRAEFFDSPEIEARADRLRDLFESKVPVTASGDGLSFTAHGKRSPAEEWNEAWPDEDGQSTEEGRGQLGPLFLSAACL